MSTNSNLRLLALAARTGASKSETYSNPDYKGLHLLINVTVAGASGGITPTIQGYDDFTQTYYDLLVGPAITTTGTKVLKIYPGIATVVGGAANDFLPQKWRVSMAVGDTSSFTYSVTANLQI